MTDQRHTPQAGIADALAQLSEETRVLVHRELQAAQQEMWQRALRAAPAAGLLAAAGVLGAFAAASSYRLAMRLLEKATTPTTAPLIATVLSSAGAGWSAAVGLRMAREAPAPVPVDAAADTSRTVTETVSEVFG